MAPGAEVAWPEGVLASILTELQTLDGRLDLALDRLADALDPVGVWEVKQVRVPR
jgi:hypothetical protein